MLIKTKFNELLKNVKVCKSRVQYHICSLTEENLAKMRYIGHPKTINYQQGKCVKIPFLGKNENRVPSVFTQYQNIYKGK